jgi:hypothetical protein
MSPQVEEFKSGSSQQYSSSMTMMMMDPMTTTTTLHPLFTQRRPDRITITIHREDSSHGLGIIWQDNVIVGLQECGLLILETSPTSSSTTSANSVLQVGDVLQRVNGLPWSATLAEDLVGATGSMVFDITTTTTTTTTMVSLPEESVEQQQTEQAFETNEDQQQQQPDDKVEEAEYMATAATNYNYDDIEQIDNLVAGRGRVATRNIVTTTITEKENNDSAAADAVATTTPGEESPTSATTTLSAGETEKKPTNNHNNNNMQMTMIQQAIIVLPDNYDGDHGLTIRAGRKSTIWTGRKAVVADGIWQHSVIQPNQRIIAIDSHVMDEEIGINVNDAYQYLQDGVLHRRRLSITILANPPSWTLRKAAVGIGGGALLGVGAVLFVSPLHPIGHAMVLGGGALLGTEFEGPRKVMVYTKDKILSSKNRLLSTIRRSKSTNATVEETSTIAAAATTTTTVVTATEEEAKTESAVASSNTATTAATMEPNGEGKPATAQQLPVLVDTR